MKKFIAACVAFIALGTLNAQKVKVEEIEVPISKKARKFGQYGGSFWNSDASELFTFYTYREKKNSPRIFDAITTKDGKASGPETNDLSVQNVQKYDLQIDETITEEADFESFDQPMVWFKRVDLGTNAVAYEGRFEAESGIFGFIGYNFEKESDKHFLMGQEDISLNMDFVFAEGPIVEKYSSKVLSQGFLGFSTLATYAYVPKGEKVVIGGVMNGRVKIGMNASTDWLRTRYLTGIYDTKSMTWANQQFLEFDYTLSNIAAVKSGDEVAVLLRKDTKGVIENNRVSFKTSEYKGLMLLIFDSKGELKSQVDLPYEDLNLPALQGMTVSNTIPSVELRRVGDDYLVSTITFGGKRNSEFSAITTYRISNGELAYQSKADVAAFEKAKLPEGEKIKEMFPKNPQVAIDQVRDIDGQMMIFGHVNEGSSFIISVDESGKLADIFANSAWGPASTVSIPLGERGWAKTNTRGNDNALYEYPAMVKNEGGKLYVLYRKMYSNMTPGSTLSHSYSTDYYTYTKYVSIDEVFAFGKLLIIDTKTGKVAEPAMFNQQILVGQDPLYISPKGEVYAHGYDGKKYYLYSVEMK